jgi:hypothetical protein
MAVTYRGDDRCLYRLPLVDRIPERQVCFPFAQYFRAFEISPDGAQVALSLDNWLYLLPNDLDLLKTVKSHADLSEKSSCHYFDPLEKDSDHRIVAKFTRWSEDGDRLAFVTHSADRQVGDVSIVRVMTYDGCQTIPQALNYFPAWHLLPEAYRRFPTLGSFAWDGKDRFAFVAALDRETGLGGLFLYDTGTWKLTGPIDWGSDCCYRDPVFSPDGSYLLFAHQAEPPDGNIRLYLAPVGEGDDPSAWIPLPLPEMNPFTRPEAVLRPALPAFVP